MSELVLDHVGFAGPDMATLRAEWIGLGFSPTAPQSLLAVDDAGATIDLQQRSAHIMLEHGYVELTEVRNSVGHHLEPWLARGPALCIVAWGAKDIYAWRTQCTEPDVSAVMTASRRIEYGERQGDARFLWCMHDPARRPAALECVVQHLTPELVFQPTVQSHPNGALALIDVRIEGSAVTGLDVLVADLERARAWTADRARTTSSGVLEVDLATAPGCCLRFIERS